MKEFIPGQLIVSKSPRRWGTMPDQRPLLLVTAAELLARANDVEAWWVTVIYTNTHQPLRARLILEPKHWEEVETNQ